MPNLPIYIVTIARAKARLDALIETASGLNLDLRPINGVDGKTVPKSDWTYFNRRGFALRSGRTPLPGEYGCYASHIIALETFLKDGSEFGLIVEDDIKFDAQSKRRLEDIIAVAPKDALIKLTCHRRSGFVKKVSFPNGVTFGRYLTGPQGSSAAYIVTRHSAQKFLATSSKMTVPYDRAIENGWDNGCNVLNTNHDIFVFGAEDTLIATQRDYKATKFSQWKRIPKNIKAAYDNVARVIYAYL